MFLSKVETWQYLVKYSFPFFKTHDFVKQVLVNIFYCFSMKATITVCKMYEQSCVPMKLYEWTLKFEFS